MWYIFPHATVPCHKGLQDEYRQNSTHILSFCTKRMGVNSFMLRLLHSPRKSPQYGLIGNCTDGSHS